MKKKASSLLLAVVLCGSFIVPLKVWSASEQTEAAKGKIILKLDVPGNTKDTVLFKKDTPIEYYGIVNGMYKVKKDGKNMYIDKSFILKVVETQEQSKILSSSPNIFEEEVAVDDLNKILFPEEKKAVEQPSKKVEEQTSKPESKETKKPETISKITDAKETYLSVSRNRDLTDFSIKLLGLAFDQLEKPYVYGSAGPDTYDCSGFTSSVFKKVGISIPRTAAEQAKKGDEVKRSELKPGDLIFFDTRSSYNLNSVSSREDGAMLQDGYAGGLFEEDKEDKNVFVPRQVTHVGLYIGNNQFIHASSGGKRVMISKLQDNYYEKRFMGARRYTVKN